MTRAPWITPEKESAAFKARTGMSGFLDLATEGEARAFWACQREDENGGGALRADLPDQVRAA